MVSPNPKGTDMKLAFAFFLLTATAAHAAPPACGSHAEMAAGLTKSYGEILQATGETSTGTMELWGNPRTHTWTFVLVSGDVACMMIDGGKLAVTPGTPT